MARKPSHSLQCGLTKAETIAGWCYLPFYLVLLSVIIQYACSWLSIPLTELTAEKEKLEQQLSEKMDRWVYLNELAEKIAEQNQK